MKYNRQSRRSQGAMVLGLTIMCVSSLLLQGVASASNDGGLLGGLGRVVNDVVDRGVDVAAEATMTAAEEIVRQSGMDPSEMPGGVREGMKDITRSMIDPRSDESSEALQSGIGKMTSSMLNGATSTSPSHSTGPAPAANISATNAPQAVHAPSQARQNTTHRSDRFSIVFPSDWGRETSTYGEDEYHRVTFVSPAGDAKIKVDWGPASSTSDPLKDWEDMDQRFRKSYGADYQLLSLERTRLSGCPAGRWEFLLTRKGTQWRKIDVGAEIGDAGYAVLCEAKPSVFPAYSDVFKKAINSFVVTRRAPALNVTTPAGTDITSCGEQPETSAAAAETDQVLGASVELEPESRRVSGAPRLHLSSGLLGFAGGAAACLVVVLLAVGTSKRRQSAIHERTTGAP